MKMKKYINAFEEPKVTGVIRVKRLTLSQKAVLNWKPRGNGSLRYTRQGLSDKFAKDLIAQRVDDRNELTLDRGRLKKVCDGRLIMIRFRVRT